MQTKLNIKTKEHKTFLPTGVLPIKARLYLAKELIRLAGQTIIGESWTHNLLKAKYLDIKFGINLKIE